MRKESALAIGLIISSTAFAQSSKQEYSAACEMHKYSQYSYLQKTMTPQEWNDFFNGEGKLMHNEWLGDYRIYESNGIRIIGERKFNPESTPVQVAFKAGRVPKSVDSKHKVAALFNIEDQMPHASHYSSECDCHEVDFNFSGPKTVQMKIDYASCV